MGLRRDIRIARARVRNGHRGSGDRLGIRLHGAVLRAFRSAGTLTGLAFDEALANRRRAFEAVRALDRGEWNREAWAAITAGGEIAQVMARWRDTITADLEAIEGVNSVQWVSNSDVRVTATLPVTPDRIVVNASFTVKD
jgi:hypothetical protein